MGPTGFPGVPKMPPKIPGVSKIPPKIHQKIMTNAIVGFDTLRTSQKLTKGSQKYIKYAKTRINNKKNRLRPSWINS